MRDTKGNESRVTMLPESIAKELKIYLQSVRIIHQQVLQKGYGSVYLPFALERKYPRAKYDGSVIDYCAEQSEVICVKIIENDQ